MAKQAVNISILADAKPFKKAMDGIGKSASGLGKLKKFAAVGAAAIAAVGAAAIAVGKKFVDLASDLEQSTGAVEAVFGDYASAITDQSMQAANSFGLSAAEFQQQSALIGTYLKNAGVDMADLGSETTEWMGLAADAAATFGGTTTEAVSAIGAAMRGEFDPLEQFGVKLSESMIQSKMATDGLTRAEATQALVVEQLGGAVGQFAREAGTLAGQQQRLGANLTNVGATIGSALLPFVAAALEVFNAFMPVVQGLADRFLNHMQPAIDALSGAMDTFRQAVADGTSPLEALGDLLTNLFGNIDTASLVEKLAVGFIEGRARLVEVALDLIDGLLTGLTNAMPAVAAAIPGVVSQIATALTTAVPQLLQGAVTLFTSLVQALTIVLPVLITGLVGMLQTLIPTLLGMVPTLIQTGLTLFQSLLTAIVQFLPMLVTGVLSLLPTLISTLLGMVPSLLQTGLELFNSLIDALLEIVPPLLTEIVGMLPQLVESIISMLPGILNAAIELFLGIVQAVPKIITDLIPAILNLLPTILSSVLKMLPALVQGAVQLFLGLVKAIPQIIPQLISAIIGLLPTIISTVLGLAGELLGAAKDLWLTIKDAIPQVLGAILSAVGSLGRNIISGVVSGLASAGGRIKDKLISIAKNALGGVMSFLGINSPSRVFRDKVGKQIVAGLALGLEKTDPVTKAMKGIQSDLLSTDLSVGDISVGTAHLNGSSSSSSSSAVLAASGPVTNNYTLYVSVDQLQNIKDIEDFISNPQWEVRAV